MNLSDFARQVGVSPQAVAKVAKAGKLGDAVTWETKGGRRFASITDVPRALEVWRSRPGAHAPALATETKTPAPSPMAPPIPNGDPLLDITVARRHYEAFRAKREQLDYEREVGSVIEVAKAVDIFARQISEAKTAILAIGQKARGRLPHLTVDDVTVIDRLARDALEGLASSAIQKSDHDTEGRA
jgi:hypothetical protein